MLETLGFLLVVAFLVFVAYVIYCIRVLLDDFIGQRKYRDSFRERNSAGHASPGTYSSQQRTAVRPSPEASKRRFASLAEAQQAVARSQADFARGGPRTSEYSKPLDHAYEKDGFGYVSSKPKY